MNVAYLVLPIGHMYVIIGDLTKNERLQHLIAKCTSYYREEI